SALPYCEKTRTFLFQQSRSAMKSMNKIIRLAPLSLSTLKMMLRLSRILSRRAVTIGIILMYAMPALSADLNAQAKALQTNRDWNGLKKLATDWTRTEPKSAAPWLYLGLADDQLGQPNNAINAYGQGLA